MSPEYSGRRDAPSKSDVPCVPGHNTRHLHQVSTSLSPPARIRVRPPVSSGRGNSRKQSCAGVAPRSGGGCAAPSPSKGVQGRGPSSGGRPLGTARHRWVAPRARGAGHRGRAGRGPARAIPGSGPEPPPARPSPCRRTTPESSCDAPMRASSLTKGYGGNPPSGRSVSPPRTGPFFLQVRRVSESCRRRCPEHPA